MRKFKVLLVYPGLQMVNLLPSNIAILSACLKKEGIDTKLFDTTFYRTAEKSVDEIRVEHLQLRPFKLREKGVDYKSTDVYKDFERVVDEYRPNIIGVSATDDTYTLGMTLISKVRHEYEDIHVIIGGVHPTFSPETVISDENVDSICIGEGEQSLVELCQRMQAQQDITGIKNLWVKANRKIYRNKLRKPIDIKTLPYEDFDIFEKNRLFRPMQGKIFRMIPISIDRGCPFNCSFCTAPLNRKLYSQAGHSRYYRARDAASVIDELKFQVERHNANYVYFNSETFFARREEQIESFAQEYAAQIGLPFWCQSHVETITQRRIKILEDMNCDRISIGLEHGNEEFRNKILHKNFSNQQALNAFKILENSRIPVTVNNVIGFPDETRDLVFDTIRLNRKITTDSINAFFFVPYSGTTLRQYCIEKGYLDPNMPTDSPMRRSVLQMPHFPPEQIKGLVRTFPLYIKMPKSYYKKIRVAEQLNDEGNSAFVELRDVYFKEYFK